MNGLLWRTPFREFVAADDLNKLLSCVDGFFFPCFTDSGQIPSTPTIRSVFRSVSLSSLPLCNKLPSSVLPILSEKGTEFKGRPGIDDLDLA